METSCKLTKISGNYEKFWIFLAESTNHFLQIQNVSNDILLQEKSIFQVRLLEAIVFGNGKGLNRRKLSYKREF